MTALTEPPRTLFRQPTTLAAVLSEILGYRVAISDDGLATIAPGKLTELNGVPHPFPYQGSKRALAHAILRFLPEDTDTLVEPFAGSAAVSIATRYAHRARRAVINDVNGPLMELWREIIASPETLGASYRQMWEEASDDPAAMKAYFLAKRAEFNKSQEPVLLLYLLNRIVKGAVRYSKNGEFNQSADNRRRGAKPDTVLARLVETAKVMAATDVRSEDYASVLLSAGPKDVVYMDPPYQGVTDVADHRYMAGLRRADYEAVLAKANAAGLSYIVSYDAITPDNKYGEPLDESLGLLHLHIAAGASAQATLSGRKEETLESLYLSPALTARLGQRSDVLM